MPDASPDRRQQRAFIVGAGIAGLAAATYLIRWAGFDGRNISVLEADSVSGGAMDGSGSESVGYLIRGGRMHEAHYGCTWDLLDGIPSLDDPATSVTQETFDFNRQVVSCSHARLLRAGQKLDVSSYGLSRHDIVDLVRMNLTPEALLEGKRIDEWFQPAFFDTAFWQMWATTFAFQRWSSVAEMRRYAIRFVHLLPGFNQLKGILRTVYNQYDSVILPLQTWLMQQGVRFEFGIAATDVDFERSGEGRRATAIHCVRDGAPQRIELGANDYVFVTLGSMVESASVGSMTAPAPLLPEAERGAWALWRRIASKDPGFGRPAAFADQVAQSKWMSFTVTLHDPIFFQHMERFTGNRAGTGGLVTLADSNWLMSVVLAHQPHFRNQPPGTFVFWGDGLLPDAPGNFVKKPMAQCSGAEILDELFAHLGIVEMMRPLRDRMDCVPCMMPFIDSQFMPRSKGDRPEVIPEGARNFAFLGQFVELPHDCVFTVEYSVRGAQTAVAGLFDCGRDVTPLYRGDHDPVVLYEALQALLR